jgi:hypothetical protein
MGTVLRQESVPNGSVGHRELYFQKQSAVNMADLKDLNDLDDLNKKMKYCTTITKTISCIRVQYAVVQAFTNPKHHSSASTTW